METRYRLVVLFFVCFFFGGGRGVYIMISTRVNSYWAKAIIVTFVLKIINSKSVSNTTFTREGFIQVNVETDKNLSLFVCCLDVIRKSSNPK